MMLGAGIRWGVDSPLLPFFFVALRRGVRVWRDEPLQAARRRCGGVAAEPLRVRRYISVSKLLLRARRSARRRIWKPFSSSPPYV